ncbi:MAG: 4Fe-4S dicluster domain-containing protein [Planctomycetaceae bacterium]|jgi:ferredoxin|nr:4Fe-4S dicluster domain-containing protein [Planctomycetaceae bacterium]
MFFLKWLRVIVAVFIFSAIAFLFVDLSEAAPESFSLLAALQFIPLIFRGGVAGLLGVVLWIFLTFLFGRGYCSVFCPYGITQDFIARVSKIGRWLFTRKVQKYSYRVALTKTRYGFLVLFGVGFVLMWKFGFAAVVVLLDPYSNFGRVGYSFFQPIVILGHNLLTVILLQIDGGKSGFQLREVPFFASVFIVTIMMFVLVSILSFFYGRRYCNTICPVGTLLGIFSRYSLFRVRLNRSACIKCGLCERVCKGECIDSKNQAVDASRCVTCFNCFGVCRKNAIAYAPQILTSLTQKTQSAKMTAAFAETDIKRERRYFLTMSFLSILFPMIGSSAMRIEDDPYGISSDSESSVLPDSPMTTDAATIPPAASAEATEAAEAVAGNGTISGVSRVSFSNDTIVLPPGAQSLENFRSKCTSCHLCVSRCPAHVLKPYSLRSKKEGGADSGKISGFMQPSLHFDHHYCNRNCTVCGNVCPTNAIGQVTVAERELLQIGIVEFVKENCVVYTQGTSCGACAEHCSNGAIEMVPYGDPDKHLTIPEVHQEFCIGCGGCESICPVYPYRAVYIKGVTVQKKAKLSYDPNEKQETIELNLG